MLHRKACWAQKYRSPSSVALRTTLSAIKACEETIHNCCKKQLSSTGAHLYPWAAELKECYGKRTRRNRMTWRPLKVFSHAGWSLSKKVKVATAQEEPWPWCGFAAGRCQAKQQQRGRNSHFLLPWGRGQGSACSRTSDWPGRLRELQDLHMNIPLLSGVT